MDATDPLIPQIARELHGIDPAAYFVSGRIVRRVIRQDQGITAFLRRLPHRKSYLLPRERLLSILDPEDLGEGSPEKLPERVILIAQPDLDDWRHYRPETLRRYVWRMLFHAQVHVELEKLRDVGKLSTAKVLERIDRIGAVRFDEIRTVLAQEAFLFSEPSIGDVFIEFVAVFQELRFFDPQSLRSYFPGLEDVGAVEEQLAELLDARQVLERTRIPGAAEKGEWDASSLTLHMLPEKSEAAAETEGVVVGLVSGLGESRAFQAQLRRAQAAAKAGNSVRAAIRYIRSASQAPAAAVATVMREAHLELERLSQRLQQALEFSEEQRVEWQEALEALLRQCARGFWTPEMRLLYDLQQVCIDHERTIYVVDAWGWLLSFGRVPLKRPLPNQREVMISRHLRSATGRLTAVRLTTEVRERLTELLQDAAHAAEHQLRHRLTPLFQKMLESVPLKPGNIPEQVAAQKVIEELSDKVIERGFLDMGSLRDTISANQLKLGDLDTVEELVFGDQLLRADRQLNRLLDGVYRRGEFYLRWFQTLSSLAFATPVGRFCTLNLILPFGGAFIILSGLEHLVHAFEEFVLNYEHEEIRSVSIIPLGLGIGVLGGVLWGLINIAPLRRFLKEILLAFYHVIRGFLLDLPRWLMRIALLREFLHSPFVIFLRRYLITPLVLALLTYYLILPIAGVESRGWAVFTVCFSGFFAVSNSRVGRNLEEASTEWLQRTWHRIRVGVFVALFEFIMEAFKRILEGVERLLYAVDEWLRFKSGESQVTLVVKAVLGMVWGVITFVIRFCLTLLVEPQINPIKHFPVVTVAHKILLPMVIPFASLLKPTLGPVWANTVATTTVFLTPGVCGFLVWELKENWKLYAANRARNLRPVAVGHHGETIARLLMPGFHSGTIPKLYARLRRAERNPVVEQRRRRRLRFEARLQHVVEAVQHFVEREFCHLLRKSRSLGGDEIRVGRIELSVNSIAVELVSTKFQGDAVWLGWEAQADELIAGIQSPGWLLQLSPGERQGFETALLGLYKLSGVDLIREQIVDLLKPLRVPYDVSALGLTVWPKGDFTVTTYYELDDRKLLTARPRQLAREYLLPTIESRRLMFAQSPILWQSWCQVWEEERQGRPLPPILHEAWRLLPAPEAMTKISS